MQEPLLPWNLFVTMIIVPIGLFALFFAIKRMFLQKDKVDTDKDKLITALTQKCEEHKDKDNTNAHAQINERLDDLSTALYDYRVEANTERAKVLDELKGINTVMNLINGSVKATKQEIELHKKGHP